MSHDPGAAFGHLSKQAAALQNQGEDFGDAEALIAAISVWREAMEVRPLHVAPDDYRKAYNNLSSAIYALGIGETSSLKS